MNQSEINHQVEKVVSLWALIGVTSWTDAAAFLGALYTLALLAEWCWKKIWRPLLVRLGYLKADEHAGE